MRTIEPRRDGTPGGPSDLFLVVAGLVLLMPTAVAVWLTTAWWLRRQDTSRWWPLLVALTLAPLLVLLGAPRAALGGLLAAVEAFRVPQWTLAPIVYACTVLLARVAWATSALAVPVGLVAATASHRPPPSLPGAPSPALRRRDARRAKRELARVDRLADKSTPNLSQVPALGVVAGAGDLPPGWVHGKHLVLPARAAGLPRLVVGRPGQGKSVYLGREVYLAGLDHRQAVVVDCKGEEGFAEEVEAAYRAGWEAGGQFDHLTAGGEIHHLTPTVHRWPAEPLNAWTGGPAAVANRLLSVWTFDTASLWYREVVDLALTLALHAPGPEVTSSRELLQRVQRGRLAELWKGAEEEEALVRSIEGKDKLDDVSIRLGNLLSKLGGLLDGTHAIGERDLTILSLPTMAQEHHAASILRVALADLLHYVVTPERRRPGQLLAVVDEFSAVVGARDHAIHLTERGRSARAATVLAVQSARGLGDDDEADRLIGAVGAVVLFGTAEPERILRLAGTVRTSRESTTIGEHPSSTYSEGREYRVDDNDVRALEPGYAYVLASGRAQRIKVLRAPGGAEPRPAGAAAGNPAPSGGPARAVASRDASSADVASRALRVPTGPPSAALDPPPTPPARGPRRPGAGRSSPPDDRPEVEP